MGYEVSHRLPKDQFVDVNQMQCTKKQAERIEDLLNSIGVYFVSPIEFMDGLIRIHTGHWTEINDFDSAMEVILQLSDLEQTHDVDELTDAVHEILSQFWNH